jgi:isovaleryl-CoA dehydrogenase
LQEKKKGATAVSRAALSDRIFGPFPFSARRMQAAFARSVVASARMPFALASRVAFSSSAPAAPAFDLFTPTPEHAALRSTVRDFAESAVAPQARAFDRDERFNEPLFKRLGAELGLLGLTADEAHGGSGMDAVAACIAHEELAAADAGFCLSFLAHSLLFVNNLNVNGSAEQKARLLPRACSGELLGGMGMSEPGSGTDVLGMATRAERVEGGAAFELSGSKMWITNGARDDVQLGDAFLVYARTGGGAGAAGRYSLFIVERGMTGFSLGQRIHGKCGMRASPTAELVFDKVRLPAATHLVGEEGGALLCMMRNLEIERL